MPKQTKAPPPPPESKKPTAAEHRLRIDIIVELVASGNSRGKIIRYVAEKTNWNVNERTIDNYLKHAYDAFVLKSEIDRKREIGKATAVYDMVLAQGFKLYDLKIVIAAQRAKCELLGLNAPKELRILEGVNEHQLAELVDILNKRGMSASEIFNALIHQLAQVDNERDANPT